MRMARAMLDRMRREPALIGGLVQAVLAVAVAFGLDLTTEQQAAILGLSAAALGVAVGVRSRVTPTVTLAERARDVAHPDRPYWSPSGEPRHRA